MKSFVLVAADVTLAVKGEGCVGILHEVSAQALNKVVPQMKFKHLSFLKDRCFLFTCHRPPTGDQQISKIWRKKP